MAKKLTKCLKLDVPIDEWTLFRDAAIRRGISIAELTREVLKTGGYRQIIAAQKALREEFNES